ncbi:benzoate-CoA ligase family protein [Roseisolibacter agri]|uniref:Acetyl-CoA synthetase n=1 Tax=Roseisolibacter agri TaxID=2014610 RepID=A0AA37Q2J4_9BACT|nr:benzoate-CoA ligase family protein [Roseisolibacter agri]GLC25209.1 acetyl-CoA synthetase [Roseisolibacter agri]
MTQSAHVDTFCREHLPARALWPDLKYDGLPELAAYPPRLNCAVELLDRAIERGLGDRPAFHTHAETWSYARLQATANRIAHALVDDLGIIPGNRVLLRAPNTPLLVACWFAVLKAGGVVVCTMPLLRTREIAYTADKAEVALALCDVRCLEECEPAMRTRLDGTPRANGRTVAFGGDGGAGSLEALMSGRPDTFAAVDTAADDVALIAFTSGTTGQGKGTMHFHRDVLAVCDCFPPHLLGLRPDDVCCGTPPLAFTFGLGGLVLFPMRAGASAVLLEQGSPPNLLDAIERFRATVSFTAPTAYRAIAGLLAAGDHDVSSLRICVSAGEALPLATFEAWKAATGIAIVDGIGATEMLHIFISASGDDIRPGSTGRVVPGYEAKVIDAHGAEVPRGTVGRLAVRGPTGCRYLGDPQRQRAYVQHGWNLTGDSYVQDADGWFWYQARTDDMIVSSGYNISGPEVESALLLHDAVQECGVVGLPDAERGQLVTAFVVCKPGVTADETMVRTLQDFVKATIAPYKYPRRIVFVDALPRTATGKLQRYRLREGAK